MNKSKFFEYIAACFLLCSSFITFQKASAPIVLRDENLSFTPAGFRIAEVTDERVDKSAVAALVYKDEAHGYVTRPVDLKDGAAPAIKQFIGRNLQQNPALRPVIISIKSLKLTEISPPGGQVNGHLTIGLSFGLQKNYGTLQLTEYTAGVRYTRPDNETDMAEPTLRHAIEDALSWFNKWMTMRADNDPRLARAVKVQFSDYAEKSEGDTIYYSAARPLTWDDFKDKPRNGDFDAEIFTSIGYTEKAMVQKGVIDLDIAVKVDVAKSDCWVKDRSENEYALNHEQRHFDIAKIVAEHFKQKIAAINLPPDNYDGDINVQYLETLRELHRVQVQYDKETHHGSDQYAQAQWDVKIDEELKALDVKN